MDDCVRAVALIWPVRSRWQFGQLQFHCGKPPPAAAPRTRNRMRFPRQKVATSRHFPAKGRTFRGRHAVTPGCYAWLSDWGYRASAQSQNVCRCKTVWTISSAYVSSSSSRMSSAVVVLLTTGTTPLVVVFPTTALGTANPVPKLSSLLWHPPSYQIKGTQNNTECR